jgi:hypothetical protein
LGPEAADTRLFAALLRNRRMACLARPRYPSFQEGLSRIVEPWRAEGFAP